MNWGQAAETFIVTWCIRRWWPGPDVKELRAEIDRLKAELDGRTVRYRLAPRTEGTLFGRSVTTGGR